MTTLARIKCGNCHLNHNTAAEIRACYSQGRTADENFLLHGPYVSEYRGMNPFTTDGVTCGKCSGSGIYQWGASVNGKMSFQGPCFACGGKGQQTDCGEYFHADRATRIMNNDEPSLSACCDRMRNDLFWRFGVRVYS